MSRKKTTHRTPKRDARFLLALCEGHTVTHAAQASGYHRTTAYEWKALDAEFAIAWEEAEAAGTETLEQEARRRAVDGHEKPVFHQGVVVGKIREYSDTLLIFLLKGRKPDTYRDNVNVSGRVANDLSGLLAFARQAPDEPVARRPHGILPASLEPDAVESPNGDSH